tara:strand:+ start:195 stop:836 length:642 start_codon:yes stop_codon:yes gene_type:complete
MKMELGNYEVEMIYHDPMIFTVEGLLSESECEHFKEKAATNMKRSMVSGYDKRKARRGLLDQRRTSSDCWISHTLDDITLDVGKRISELVQIPLSHAEAFQVLHYADSQEYQAHLDTFDPTNKEYSHYLKNGGQRIITAIAYLNNVKEGGETSFPKIDKVIHPKRGKVVVFHDCYKGTDEPHPNSFHGALPVISGEKWAFNLWFRKNPVNQKI